MRRRHPSKGEHMTWWMYLIGIAHTAVYVWAFWRSKK